MRFVIFLAVLLPIIMIGFIARGAGEVSGLKEHCTSELHGIAITDRNYNIYCLDPSAVLKVY